MTLFSALDNRDTQNFDYTVYLNYLTNCNTKILKIITHQESSTKMIKITGKLDSSSYHRYSELISKLLDRPKNLKKPWLTIKTFGLNFPPSELKQLQKVQSAINADIASCLVVISKI